MNYRLQEKIDDFHAGRMTPEESSSFQNELARDPSLIAESDFQGEIVNGLKEYRKSQLKERLDAVELAPTWFEFTQQSALLKSFGGVVVATMIGAGVYLSAEEENETAILAPIVINAPLEKGESFNWIIKPAEPAREIENTSLKTKTLEVVEAVENSDFLVEGSKKDFVLSFEAPNVGKIEDEEALQTSSLEELPANQSIEANVAAIDVDSENIKSLDVRYKYYDGKLFLSGDFDRAPYEILEINSASGRRIYVKYLNKYYRVETTDRLRVLPEVKDQAVIEELKLLRKSK